MKLLPQMVESPEGVGLFGGGEGLAPLRLVHLAPGVAPPFHIFMAADAVPGEFVLTWRRGRPLPPKVQEMVWGYFAVAEAREVLTYLLFRVGETGAGGGSPALPLLADTLLVWTQDFFCHDAARTPEKLAEARSLLNALAPSLALSENVLETVGGLRRHDSGLFSHCLNVSLLALAFALHLGWEGTEAETLALGALLHDLGMMPGAQKTFHQTAPLSDQDWEAIKAHPQRGAELLTSLEPIPNEVLLMIRQHHESPDGSGYPLGLSGSDIHPWARALRILDSYEAMTSLRPWRPPLSGRQARRIMASAWSGRGGYDQEYLESFLDFCHQKGGKSKGQG
jgi:putative nucleotidyltransferase with HDIG domain